MSDLRKAAEQAAKELKGLIHWHGIRYSNDKLMPAHRQPPEIKSAMKTLKELRQALAQNALRKLAEIDHELGLYDDESVAWDGACVLGHCDSPAGCEESNCCRANYTAPVDTVNTSQEHVDELKECVHEFFAKYLNHVEESDSGRLFNPVTIGCCRALMMGPLNQLLERMRVLSGAKPNPCIDGAKVGEVGVWGDSQALAEPANSTTSVVEPVAWVEMDKDYLAVSADPFENAIPVYTAPPKREWVGLTRDEVLDIEETTKHPLGFYQVIEAKLKEKNT
jgi:hypothetical protein